MKNVGTHCTAQKQVKQDTSEEGYCYIWLDSKRLNEPDFVSEIKRSGKQKQNTNGNIPAGR